ncbi:MAG: hypothetical protein V1674_01380 [Candidatus Omnitrophota bacterium]
MGVVKLESELIISLSVKLYGLMAMASSLVCLRQGVGVNMLCINYKPELELGPWSPIDI